MVNKYFYGISLYIVGLLAQVLNFIVHSLLKNVIGSKKGKLPPIKDTFIEESAVSLAKKIRTKQLRSVDVVKAYIKRIESVNSIINAVVDERFADALKEAESCDEYVEKSGKSPDEIAAEKPLLGVPFSSKNAIGIKGLILNAGVVLKKSDRAQEDSDVVALLREAGGIPLCISNVPEYCMWIDSSNTVYGVTKNPYDLTRIPGGSSGGEGALVTSSATGFGVGNDLGGSIRIPSYNCGIFGHKPSKRVISNRGQFPSSYRTDLDNYNVTGPMSRHAEDLLPLMQILTKGNESLLNLSSKVNIKDVKIYYTDDYAQGGFFSPLHPELRDSVYKVVHYLEKITGNKAQKIKFPVSPSKFFSMTIGKYGTAKAPDMIEIITGKEESNFSLGVEFLKWCLGLCNHTIYILYYVFSMRFLPYLAPKKLARNNELLRRLEEELPKILGDNGVLIFPPQPQLPYYHQEQFLKFQNIWYTCIFNILGYPSTMCPVGLSKNGLPLGVQVIGKTYNDRLTIGVAREIEKGFGGWVNPSTKK